MNEDKLRYAFVHLVAGYANPDDPHSDDSIDLAYETLEGHRPGTIRIIDLLAREVAGNYIYTGEMDAQNITGEGFDF